MAEAVIVFPLRAPLPLAPDAELLLIKKKRGLGAGLYNGPGGKVEGHETPRSAAIRETEEEVGLTLEVADRRARFDFYFGDTHVFDCHVFTSTSFSGRPVETPEAAPRWCPRRDIPYDEMWDDDQYWLPRVLDGEYVSGSFRFDPEGEHLETWDIDAHEGMPGSW